MEESSLRILAQAGLSGVFFAAKILRGELPHYSLPLPEFAAKILPCSAPLNVMTRDNEHPALLMTKILTLIYRALTKFG